MHRNSTYLTATVIISATATVQTWHDLGNTRQNRIVHWAIGGAVGDAESVSVSGLETRKRWNIEKYECDLRITSFDFVSI